jgi:phosphate transport system protein
MIKLFLMIENEQPRQLLTLEKRVLELFSLVSDGILGATEALLSSDRQGAKELLTREQLVDELYADIESLVLERIATLDLPRERLHELISILRMLPELERSGDLAEHIAWRATRGIGGEMNPRLRGIVQRMGELAAKMWTQTANGFLNYSKNMVDIVDELDDELDELHVTLTAELVSGSISVPIAIELAMVGRFYERLGDHAVNLARRISAMASNKLSGPSRDH